MSESLVLILLLASGALVVACVVSLHRRVRRLESDAIAEFGADFIADLEGACREIDEKRQSKNAN